MMDRKKTVFLSAVFFVFLFAVSLIPVTATGTPAVNSDAQTRDSPEEDKAVTLATGTTSGKFSDIYDWKFYIFDVTPGIWNITFESANVSFDCQLFEQLTYYDSYLDENVTTWDYPYDYVSLGPNEVNYFDYMDWEFPSKEGLSVTTPGKLILSLYPGLLGADVLAESWHYKIYLSYQAPASISSGNVNIVMDENLANAYSFTVANSGLYNITFDSNSSDYKIFVFSERGDYYTECESSGTTENTLYLETGITYYYFVYSEDDGLPYFDGVPLSLNVTLTYYTPVATITGTGTTTIGFAADELVKTVLWAGSPEGVYQITADSPNRDIGLGVTSLTDEYAAFADDVWVGDENITLFIRTLEIPYRSSIIGEDSTHFASVAAFSPSLGGYMADVAEFWSNDRLGIFLVNYSGTGDVVLTVTQLPIDEISFDTATPFTINESSSDTSFKVFQFESQLMYEYGITIVPDVNSLSGSSNLFMAPSFYVGVDTLQNIGFGGWNCTSYDEVIGGEQGSDDPITSYLLLGMVAMAPPPDWGTFTITVEETEPTELDVDEEVIKSFASQDLVEVYKVELKADTSYTIDLQLSQDSVGSVDLDLFSETAQMPDVSTTEVHPDLDVGEGIMENTMTLYSHSDQTVYIMLEGQPATEVTLTVSEIEEPFALEGLIAYLALLGIPLALIVGLFIGKKTG